MNKIGYEERRAIYKAAVDKWGGRTQAVVAIEEMSELQKEICKQYRCTDPTRIKALAEEIADVTIMLEQLRFIFDCNDEVCEQMDYKIGRLAHRLEEKMENGNVKLISADKPIK